MRPDGRGLRWWWPAVPAVSAGLLGVGLLGPDLLARGGLAIPACSAAFAIFLGASTARLQWVDDAQTPSSTASDSLVQVACWGSLGAAAASLTSDQPLFALLAGCAVAAILCLVPKIAAGLGALLAIAVTLTGAGLLTTATPWSLLEPSFDRGSEWVSTALVIGALVGMVPGAWRSSPRAHPGRLALPALPAGLGLLVLVAGCILVATDFEQSTGASRSALGLGAAASMVVVAASTIWSREPSPKWLGAMGVSVAAAVWFWFRGPEDQWAWFSASAPILLGVALTIDSWRTRSVVRGLGALTLLGSVAFCFPGVSSLVLPAIAVVLPLVGAAWYAGTRAVGMREAR